VNPTANKMVDCGGVSMLSRLEPRERYIVKYMTHPTPIKQATPNPGSKPLPL